MNVIPNHTARLVERLLASYCERVCPPSARHTVELRFDLAPDRATLSERRRFCGVPGAHHYVPLAQFRYAASAGAWRLFHTDASGRWRRYPGAPGRLSFLELLRRFDADPEGRFWCRVNGKSLRWCRSAGRCEGCDERYCRILGLDARSEAAIEPLRRA